MTAFARTDGKRVTFLTANLGTSEVLLATATAKKTVTLESVTFCNTSGTNERFFNFYIKRGSGNVHVFKACPLAQWQTKAIDSLSLTLADGESFAASATVLASGIDITIVTIESTSQQEQGGSLSLDTYRGAQA